MYSVSVVPTIGAVRTNGVIVRHNDIMCILEEADIEEPWRALPFIYGNILSGSTYNTDEIMNDILISGTYEPRGNVDNHSRFVHDLIEFVYNVKRGITVGHIPDFNPATQYVYEVVPIDPHSVIITFRFIETDYGVH